MTATLRGSPPGSPRPAPRPAPRGRAAGASLLVITVNALRRTIAVTA
ncbi:hypothetical protein ACFW5X_31370 [Streptomyces albogriseolus]|nr:hypothetical protein [Streptomyces sp. CL7]WPP28319.1 hypothetical protein SJH97_02870 [Streptomyces sp. CL7]